MFLSWLIHLFILHSCSDIISRHYKSCFTIDFIDFCLKCSASLNFYVILTSVAFFFVEEPWTFSYWSADTMRAERLFFGVDNPEIMSFFLFLSFSCNPPRFKGFWNVNWLSDPILIFDLDLEMRFKLLLDFDLKGFVSFWSLVSNSRGCVSSASEGMLSYETTVCLSDFLFNNYNAFSPYFSRYSLFFIMFG